MSNPTPMRGTPRPAPLCALIAFVSLAACTPNLQALVHDYQAAVNTGDVESLMKLYAPDVVFENVGVWTKRGHAELEPLARYDAAVGANLSIDPCQKDQDGQLSCQVTERARWVKLIGLAQIRYRATFVFRDAKLVRIRAQVQPEDAKRLGAILQRAMGWASQKRPDLFKAVMPGGEFNYTAQGGRAWMALLRAWKDASE